MPHFCFTWCHPEMQTSCKSGCACAKYTDIHLVRLLRTMKHPHLNQNLNYEVWKATTTPQSWHSFWRGEQTKIRQNKIKKKIQIISCFSTEVRDENVSRIWVLILLVLYFQWYSKSITKHAHSTLTDTIYILRHMWPLFKHNTEVKLQNCSGKEHTECNSPKISTEKGICIHTKQMIWTFTSFCPPRVLFQGRQERWQYQFHSMSRKFAHDNASCIICSITDILTTISKTQQ